MPNWVTNTVKTSVEDFPKLLSALTTYDEQGETIVDFNKVVPMNKDLNITSGSGSYYDSSRFNMVFAIDQISVQDNLLNPFFNKFYREDMTQKQFVEEAKKHVDERKDIKEALDKICHNNEYEPYFAGMYNTKKYGYADWYNAQTELWGTKWNAHDTRMFEQYNAIEFQTAWSCPEPIILELSKQFPLYITFADEDIGSNFGCYKAENGKLTNMLPKIYEELHNHCEEKNVDVNDMLIDVISAYACSGYTEEDIYSMFYDETWYDDEFIKNHYKMDREELTKQVELISEFVVPKIREYTL